MRIGVIGLAGVGRNHLEVLSRLPQYEIAAACDINGAVLAERTADMDLDRYTDAQEMMDNTALDAVSLCTPPKVHLPHTELAAERGIHVLCEKPMAPDTATCQRMIDACERAGVVLMIAHKKRYVSAIRRLKELADGPLGPIEVLMHRYPHPWMPEHEWFWAEDDGGGPLVENAVHAADTLRFLLGDVSRIYAEGDVFNARHHAPQLNVALYTARFASGAIAMVGAGMVSIPTPGMIFEDIYVACTHGIAEVSGPFDNPNKLTYAFRDDFRKMHTETFGDDPFVREFEHFDECVRTGASPLTSGYEGMKAVELCHAVKRSARSETPVTVGN